MALNDIQDDDNVWIVQNKLSRNKDELLEENSALQKQYEELKLSTEFNNSELESLKQFKKLKNEVSSLKDSLREMKEDVDTLHEDLATAVITQLHDSEQLIQKKAQAGDQFMELPKPQMRT